jgi:hypothetical protein
MLLKKEEKNKLIYFYCIVNFGVIYSRSFEIFFVAAMTS